MNLGFRVKEQHNVVLFSFLVCMFATDECYCLVLVHVFVVFFVGTSLL